jgi:hypothetical protein
MKLCSVAFVSFRTRFCLPTSHRQRVFFGVTRLKKAETVFHMWLAYLPGAAAKTDLRKRQISPKQQHLFEFCDRASPFRSSYAHINFVAVAFRP